MSRPRTLLLLLSLLFLAERASAAWNPPGIDLSRPRLLFRASDLPTIQARIGQEPWRSIVVAMQQRSAQADGVALDDHSITSEFFKSRAARNNAFLYAVDRTLVNGQVVPFPTPEARKAVGDRVRDWLVAMYTRDRLAVPAPLGGWDRDIDTSEELLSYASAYDALLGAGYDFGAAKAVIEKNIVDLTSELYDNYAHPETAQNFADEHKNNHRSKSSSSMVLAAIAVAEYTPAPGTDPNGIRDPATWLAYGIEEADLILRYVTITGDGAYAEGPFYWRFATQNIVPYTRAWDRLVNGASWQANGVDVPSLWRHPLFARVQRWMLDMTLPDGTMAPVDDSNPGRAYYFGVVPPGLPDAAAYAWRWANAPPAYENDGNVDLAPDSIIIGEDGVTPAAPTGSPTSFYFEGGNAIFRSDWSPDAVMAIAQAEGETASLFGRDRNGLGVTPQSHEHAEPGAFLMHAFGERLALDPGYLSFAQRTLVNQPEDHNIILVDGRGPFDFLAPSVFFWKDLKARPPADGLATLSDALDTGFLDAATATVRYGNVAPVEPTLALPLIQRRFLFPDDRYLVVADTLTTRPGEGKTFTWLLHGNGGGTSGGSFTQTAVGGRWSRPAARLDEGLAVDTGVPLFATSTGIHEAPGKIQQTHTVLRASTSGEGVRAAMLLYPTRAGDAPPEIADLSLVDAAGLRAYDAAGDRRVAFVHRSVSGIPLALPAAATGLRDAESDGSVALFDAHADGALRLAWAEDATRLVYDGTTRLAGATPGRLGLAVAAGRAQVVADNQDAEVRLPALGFVATAADGACALRQTPDGPVVRLGRERRFVLRANGGNSAPAADPGGEVNSLPGVIVTLDGSASCDADGDALTPHWELVSAPAGSSWSLTGTDTMHPRLATDRSGPYRVRFVVTDSHGAASLPADLLILSGRRCSDGVDNDLDGLFDYPEDPGCKSADWLVEDPQCSDGKDNDGDGLVDYPADPQCQGPYSFREDILGCGLGFELSLVLPPILWLRQRRRA